MGLSQRRKDAESWLLDSCAVVLLAAALVWPLFRAEYLGNWETQEGRYVADARFLAEHWPHPRWQPLWYGGTRFDYIFPPFLRYGTAALSRWLSSSPARAYHGFTAWFYCVGIAAIYVFIRAGSGSRGFAWLGAAVVAVVSPASLFLSQARADELGMAPARLSALVRFGEGPHLTGLALLPLALAAAWLALRRSQPRLTVTAAVLGALVGSTDLYAGLSLMLLLAILSWALWITHQDNRIGLRAVWIASLAYGLMAFWLTPSYVAQAWRNFSVLHGNLWSPWIALALANLFVWGSARVARGRRDLAYLVFVLGASLFLSLCVYGGAHLNCRLVGDPWNWDADCRLALTLLAVEMLRRMWNGSKVLRAAVVVALLVAAAAGRHYLAHPWNIYRYHPAHDFRERVEYQIPEWMARNWPEARAFVTGSVRFWYNTWRDGAQMGELPEQGMSNPVLAPALWRILQDEGAELPVLWMQCLGVDAVVVPEEHSLSFYRDFTNPGKFAGVLPVSYNNRKGDVIYRVPRRFPGLARVVDAGEVRSLRPVRDSLDADSLRAYVRALENGPESEARTWWESNEVLRIRARIRDGEAIVVQATYDPSWRAWSEGRSLPVRRDVMGQMLIEAPPGEHDIRLVFGLPLEYAVGRTLSLLCLGLALVLLIR